jgi:DNA-binding LacI/PurR family transcriptional regulator
VAAGPRRTGVVEALRHAGLDPGTLVAVSGDGRVDGGSEAVARLLERPSVPTAIVAYNDLSAIGALRALRDAGMAVPATVSVVGFDDIEPASWTDPPLTTVRQPTTEMGRWAVERITSALQGRWVAARVSLRPELVVRSSTAPPPAD